VLSPPPSGKGTTPVARHSVGGGGLPVVEDKISRAQGERRPQEERKDQEPVFGSHREPWVAWMESGAVVDAPNLGPDDPGTPLIDDGNTKSARGIASTPSGSPTSQ